MHFFYSNIHTVKSSVELLLESHTYNMTLWNFYFTKKFCFMLNSLSYFILNYSHEL